MCDSRKSKRLKVKVYASNRRQYCICWKAPATMFEKKVLVLPPYGMKLFKVEKFVFLTTLIL